MGKMDFKLRDASFRMGSLALAVLLLILHPSPGLAQRSSLTQIRIAQISRPLAAGRGAGMALVRYTVTDPPHPPTHVLGLSFESSGQSYYRMPLNKRGSYGDYGAAEVGVTIDGSGQGGCVLSHGDKARPRQETHSQRRSPSRCREEQLAYQSQMLKDSGTSAGGGGRQLAGNLHSLQSFIQVIRGEGAVAKSGARMWGAQSPVNVMAVPNENALARSVNRAVRDTVSSLVSSGGARNMVSAGSPAEAQFVGTGAYVGAYAGTFGYELASASPAAEAYDPLATTDVRSASVAMSFGSIASGVWQPVVLGGIR